MVWEERSREAPLRISRSLSAEHWALLLYYAIAASVLSTWLWLSGLKTVPANHAGVFSVALPLSSTFIAVAVLGETLTPGHFVAFACAVAGILLIATAPAAADKAVR